MLKVGVVRLCIYLIIIAQRKGGDVLLIILRYNYREI